MKCKRFVALAAAAALSVSALAGCSSSSTAASGSTAAAGSTASAASGDKVVKIGVFEPSTGDSASGGKKEMLGMQYANAETPTVEIGGETYQVELVYADNGSSTDKAPSAAAELVSQGVSLVLGSYGSGVSIAGGPVLTTPAWLPSASPAPTPTSPPATTITTASASWTPSRVPFWPTSPRISSTPKSPTAWRDRQ